MYFYIAPIIKLLKMVILCNKYLKILEENKDLFGKDIGMMEPEQ